jgi:hypothetical protein
MPATINQVVASSGFVNPTTVTITNLNQSSVADNYAVVEVIGTSWTSLTATFQGTADGVTWVNLAAYRYDNATIETSPTFTNGTPRIWRVDVTGFQQFRVNVTALSTANATFQINTGNTGPTPFAFQVTSGTLAGNVTLTDANNIVLGTTTGSKIGTATTQKLGFFNAAPIVQPQTSADQTTAATGSANTVFLNTTFTGASGTITYTIGGVVTSLKALGLLAP